MSVPPDCGVTVEVVLVAEVLVAELPVPVDAEPEDVELDALVELDWLGAPGTRRKAAAATAITTMMTAPNTILETPLL